MKCGACQRECRVTKTAAVAMPGGDFKSKRVCVKCFNGAIHFVMHVTQAVKPVDETKASRRAAADTTKAAVKKLRSTAEAYRKSPHKASVGGDAGFADGRAAGLDQAADLLEGGDY